MRAGYETLDRSSTSERRRVKQRGFTAICEGRALEVDIQLLEVDIQLLEVDIQLLEGTLERMFPSSERMAEDIKRMEGTLERMFRFQRADVSLPASGWKRISSGYFLPASG